MTIYRVDKADLSRDEFDGLLELVEHARWPAFMAWAAKMQGAWDKENRNLTIERDAAQVVRGQIRAFEKLLQLRRDGRRRRGS